MRMTLRLLVVFLIAAAGFTTVIAQEDATAIMKKVAHGLLLRR